MFYQQHRIAGVNKPAAHVQHRPALIGVQASRRLVQHIRHAEEAGTQLGGEPDALQFTRREALGGPVQAQVRQPQLQGGGKRRQDLLEQ